MKEKLYSKVGSTLILAGILFLLVHTFVVVKGPSDQFAQDLFGLPIYTPPTWISMVPYLGFFLGLIYENFSLHGIVGLGIALTLIALGSMVHKRGEKR